MEKAINIYIFVGKHYWRRPRGRPMYTLEDNIKMELGEVGRWEMDGTGSG
jgi:hypothetical protein